MLSKSPRSPESSEPTTPNPPSYLSDRRLNKEDKEDRTRSSGSSSGGSSASDLKRRLRDLPSPNEAAFVASRAINTSRRLSRKRDLYFYSASNRIEENEEKEEQESHQAKRSLDSKNSDARNRRRAKLRAGVMQAHMIASRSTSENNSDDAPSLDATPRTGSQRHTPLLRTPSTLSARCDQLPVVSDSSRSQKSPPLFRVFSNTASLCSPPSKFGGYRPNSGVILHNLSSGSDPGSDYDNVTDRIGFPSKIELRSASSYNRISRVPTPQEVIPSRIDLGSASGYNRVSRMPIPQEVFPLQIDLGSASSYDRVSRMSTPQEGFNNLDSSRNLIASSGSRMSLDKSLTAIDESPVNDEQHGSSRMSFYRVKDTSRSECCNTKDSTDKTSDQRKFLSARESLRGYRMQTLEPSSPFGIRRDVPGENAHAEVRCYDDEDRYAEKSLRSYQVSSSKDSLSNLSHSNFIINTDQTASSGGPYAKGSAQSLESVSSKPGFENLKMQYQKNLESPVIKAALSRGDSARGSVQSLISVSSKPGSENLKTQYQEKLESPVTKAPLSGGHSARGSVQSLISASSRPGSENLKTQYQEKLESPVTKAPLSGVHSAKGSVQSLESMSPKPGFENLRTQYQEMLESPVTKAPLSGGHSARGSVQSLMSVSSKPGSQSLKTQYQEKLESPVTKVPLSGVHSAKGSVQSLESMSPKPGFENLRTQYQEMLESPVTKASFSGGHSARGSVQSLESISPKPGFENLKMQYQENLGSPVTSASPKRFLVPGEIKATRIPLSTSRIHEKTKRLSPSQLRDCSSERSSAKLEVHGKDSKKMEGNVLGRVSTRSQDSAEYINVPSLALNSKDMSSSTSSLNKTAPRKHVNAADLIEALSNASLLQTEHTYRCSPGANSRKREIVNDSMKSMKFDENYERCTSSRSHSTRVAESPKSREEAAVGPVSAESGRRAHLKDFLVSNSKNEINHPSDKESPARNFEDNETRTTDLENDVDSKAIKNENEGSASKGYEKSQNSSSSSLLQVDEIFKSEPPANQQGPNEDSEDSESSRSEGKPTNRYTASLNCYMTLESLSNNMENSEEFLTELKSVEYKYPISYQVNYLQSTYEGEVCEKLTERARLNLLQNKIGDGRDAFVVDPDGFESSSSSDDEDPQDKPIEGKVRVSLEKMAAEQFRRNIFAEQARVIQSDTLSLFNDNFYDSPISVVQSASTSKLRYSHDSPKFRKKSQDRFPFTMSEKPSVASHKHPGRLESLNKESKSLERTYKLELHPSITRLAGEGIEDTPAEIIDYVSFSEERPPRSGMRRFMMKFSARLKKSKKPAEEAGAKTTDVLYENRNYQGDSVIDSCSESSLLKELKVSSSVSKNPTKESPDEKSSAVHEKSPIKNQSPQDTLRSIDSRRPRHRDDLWVQEIEKPDSNRIEEIKITETPKKIEDKSKKDPYSVFFVKSSHQTPETSARESARKEEPKSELSTGKRNKVMFGSSALAVKPETTDKNVLRVQIKRRALENRKDTDAGCLCLRFYRMIIPAAKHRSRNSKSVGSLSAKRRPGFSPGKKKG